MPWRSSGDRIICALPPSSGWPWNRPGSTATFSRFEYLPSLLETSPNVFRLLGDPALQHLKSINLLAGADNLYFRGTS
jgi:hypothetical protein